MHLSLEAEGLGNPSRARESLMTYNLPPRMTSEQRAERLRIAEIDGKSARADYEASVASEVEKTARLKALRLERDRAAAMVAVPAKAPATRAKPKRRNIS